MYEQTQTLPSPDIMEQMARCFSKMLWNFLDQQIQIQRREIALIQSKILEYDRSSSRSLLSDQKETCSELQDPGLEEKRRCGRPVTNTALEQQVKSFIKYLENRGMEVNRPLCRLVISQISGQKWSYGWSRKFMVRYFRERDQIQESTNITLAERLYEMALARENDRNSPRGSGKRKKKRSKH